MFAVVVIGGERVIVKGQLMLEESSCNDVLAGHDRVQQMSCKSKTSMPARAQAS